MVVDLKFSRFNEEPWGFRLTGGADMEFPLTVIKVTEKSLADQAGLKFGDIVVRINDTPASNLSHLEAHNVLLLAGNNFMIGVKRDNEEIKEDTLDDEVAANAFDYASDNETEVREILYNAERQKENEVDPEELVEEQIAEVLSSEAEVLKEHNIIGVNFNKLIPKASAIKSSAVLKELNEEAIKTAEDKKKEDRKWTTFLQKPNRPIPKTKEEIAREKLPQYKVNIVKQPKPRVAPGQEPAPPQVQCIDESQLITTLVAEEVAEIEPELNGLTEVGDNPPKDEVEVLTEDQIEEMVASTMDNDVPDLVADALPEETPAGIPSDLERQLADVQKQLLALSNLPQAIQATLDAVTTELAKIVPVVLSHQASVDRDYRSKSVSRDIEPPTVEIEETIEETIVETVEVEEARAKNRGGSECSSQSESSPDEVCSVSSVDTPAPSLQQLEHQQEQIRAQIEIRRNEECEEESRPRQKSKLVPGKLGVNTASVFGPLVPQSRPIYLPGGRKWRTAKDAYNEDFIKEVISSQAELIVGSTLGTYESPLLPYDTKVNFLKYKKPEKKLDLQNSEVYRYLNQENNAPRRGIEARPERVYTEADVRRSFAPGQ